MSGKPSCTVLAPVKRPAERFCIGRWLRVFSGSNSSRGDCPPGKRKAIRSSRTGKFFTSILRVWLDIENGTLTIVAVFVAVDAGLSLVRPAEGKSELTCSRLDRPKRDCYFGFTRGLSRENASR